MYVLQYWSRVNEDEKLLGVFKTEEKAIQARNDSEPKHGWGDPFDSGIAIHEFNLNELKIMEGFNYKNIPKKRKLND